MADNLHKVAIIGFAGGFPDAECANELWDLTSSCSSAIKRTNQDQIAINLSSDIVNNMNFMPFGGGLNNFKNFDPSFFGYSPKEASYLDPQIRKALEYSWHAFEHAGYCPNSIETPAGVYLASSVNSYFVENLSEIFYKNADEDEKTQMLFLNEADFLSTRVAHFLNLKGPAFTLKSGCSSSSAAIHNACNGLYNFDCDLALAGGVSIKPRYNYGYIYADGGIQSSDGSCIPFSDNASGTVFTNGIGIVVLKRLDDAIQDGDTIHGIIRSTFINNDGSDKVGYMAPSVTGQVACMQGALAYAELNPNDVQYIEAHGTATQMGDPIEYTSLKKVFSNLSSNSITLSSVKSNIGHLDAASGVAGLIKVLLDLEKHTISPIANFNNPNPKLETLRSPIQLATSQTKWNPGNQGRMAVISSFGIGGTNVNIVLEEHKQQSINNATHTKKQNYLFVFSAKTTHSLMMYLKEFKNYLSLNSTVDIKSLSYTLLVGRCHFNFRYAIIADNKDDLLRQIDNITDENQFVSISKHDQIDLTEDHFNNPQALKDKFLQGAMIRNTGSKIDKCYRIVAPLYQFERKEFWIYPQQDTKGLNEKIPDVSQWFYLPDWQITKIPERINISGKQILFLSSDNIFCKKLALFLEDNGAKLVNININEFDIREKSEWVSLLSKLKKTDQLPDITIHAWCLTDMQNKLKYDYDSLGVFSLLYLYQASIQVIGDVSFLTTIVANNIFNMNGCEQVSPLKSTLLGISQVLPKEHENAICQLIDIDLSQPHSSYLQPLLQEITYRQNGELALRQNKRFVRKYSKIRMDQNHLGDFTIKANKNYLILGGLGNFGIELAEFIGALNKGNVFLTTRMNFPKKDEWDVWLKQKGLDDPISKKISTLQELILQGAKIEVLQTDVANIQSLYEIQSYIEDNYGNLSGVVHAAGIVESGMIQNKSVNSLQSVFAAKIEGTQNIGNVFLGKKLDFLILCSSMNSIIGGLGQLDNTAANAYIDAYSEYCLNSGYKNVVAINWGAVNEARARNYSTLPQFSDLSREHIKNRMTKKEIFDVYYRIFSSNLAPRVVVSTINFNEVITNWAKVGSLKSLIKKTNIEKNSRGLLTNIIYEEPQNEFEQFIANLWQELLGIDSIGLNDDFFELGGNSLIAIQSISLITKKYSIKIHAMSIYEYPTLQKFSSYIKQSTLEMREKQKLMKVVT